MSNEVYVLDTSALVGGFFPEFTDADQLTVPEVVEEAQSLSVKLKLETAITLGQIKVKEPSEESVSKVQEKIGETGDKVSKTDVKILALALEIKEEGEESVVVSDDYAIQNLSVVLDLSYSRIAKPGIKKVFEWKKECPSCGETYSTEKNECEVCGAELVRKPKT